MIQEGQDSSRASRASTPVDPFAYETSKQTFNHIFDRNTVLEEENMSLQNQLHDSHFQQDEMVAEIGELKRELEQMAKQKTKAEEKIQSLVQLFKEMAKTAEDDSQSRVQALKDAAENAAEDSKSRAQIFKDAAKKAEELTQVSSEEE
jgi:Mg2+ and Co2+ transporter CorA